MLVCSIDWGHFTPYTATMGGILIGFASSLLLLFNGRICGISGIVGQLLKPNKNDIVWRILFFMGLLTGGFIATYNYPTPLQTSAPIWLIIVAGLLVGFGTRLGSGCTSGHGVCGISRLSPRSIIATVTFMLFGMITTYCVSMLGILHG